MGLAIVTSSLGMTAVEGATRRERQRVLPSAGTATVFSSFAEVWGSAYDGGGPTVFEKERHASDFEVFDKTARAADDADADRVAVGSGTQLTTVVIDAGTIIVQSRGSASARLYDSRPADGFKPEATSSALLDMVIEVEGGSAMFSLTGTLHGDSDAANLLCGTASVKAPDGSVREANEDCGLDDGVAFDIGGSIEPGFSELHVVAESAVSTTSGRRVRAGQLGPAPRALRMHRRGVGQR